MSRSSDFAVQMQNKDAEIARLRAELTAARRVAQVERAAYDSLYQAYNDLKAEAAKEVKK